MDPRLLYLALLLTGLLSPCRAAEAAQSLYTIDSVVLTLRPGGRVQSGTPVTLRCEVSVSHDPAFALTHTFSFLQDDVLVYAKNTSQSEALHQLLPARAVNSGSYECRVKVQDKSQSSHTEKLTVTGLQTPVLTVGPSVVIEGDAVTATCSAPDESGSLLFHFYVDGQKVRQVRSAGNQVETSLELKHSGDRLLTCNFDITLLPDAGRSNSSNAVQVMVKALYITPVMNIIPSDGIVEGDVVEVVCKVVDPPSNVEVFLVKNRRVLKRRSVSLSHRLTVLAEDTGDFVCRAERGNVQKEAYKGIVVKELFSSPVLRMEPREVFEGDRFTLTCYISQYSPERISGDTVSFSIFRGRALVAAGGNYSVVAQPAHNGNYTCQASAMRIVKDSKTTIGVNAKVPVSVPVLSVVGARLLVLGRPFRLRCHSENGSLPVRYTLRTPGGLAQVRTVRRPQDAALFNVTPIHRTSEISGFSCLAQNQPPSLHPPRESSGDLLRLSTLIIEPVSKPILTTRPPLGDVAEGDDLVLTCTVARGTPPITYQWYHGDSDTPLRSEDAGALQGHHTLRAVERQHGGGYYCVTSNQSHDSRRSAVVTVAVKLAGWKKGLIATLCILLTLALIVVIVVKKGLLPFGRKRTAELSVKSVSAKSVSAKTEERLSLTQEEVNMAANVTPGVMGRSVWSEHVSGSESDDQSEGRPEPPETQYTEVTPQETPCRAPPVKKGTDTVYSEVQGAAEEQADGQGSVEYAQLNHDIHDNHDDHHDHHNTDDHNNHSNHADHNGLDDHNDCGAHDD